MANEAARLLFTSSQKQRSLAREDASFHHACEAVPLRFGSSARRAAVESLRLIGSPVA